MKKRIKKEKPVETTTINQDIESGSGDPVAEPIVVESHEGENDIKIHKKISFF